MTTHLVAGLDLGSTGVKVLIAGVDGTEVLIEQSATPWTDGPGGTTDMAADALLTVVREVLVTASRKLCALVDGAFSVDAIAVSGMGETGLLVDSAGAALAPAIAWFDPRGREEIDGLPVTLRTQFASRTGLPLGVQVSLAKILWLREQGVRVRHARWFNLPEYIVTALGGLAASEYSLASRTGLLDQDTGGPWPEMLDYLGITSEFLPPLVDAGTDLGVADADWLASPFFGARLTVAGHDHLVAAVSGGAIADDRYHASFGTAEVLLRVLNAPLSGSARARLAERFINSVRHVVPGQHVLVAGVKTGLLMRRALQLAGIQDRAGRDRLDADVLALPIAGELDKSALEVHGARNDDGVLRLTIRADGVSPAELFAAVLRHGNDEIERLIEVMDREVPPARSTVLSGGWAGMASVQRARAAVLPGLVLSHRSQDTAFGAALFAARLLSLVRQPARSDFEPGDDQAPSWNDRQSDSSPLNPKTRRPMNQLTTLEQRAMSRILTPGGRMLIVAADQRNGMKAVMTDAPDGPSSISAGQLADAKTDLVTYLANYAPAILLDPQVALPRVVAEKTLDRATALVVGMDASGFETVDGLRYTEIVDTVTPRTVRDLGGDLAKMLFYMRPDKQDQNSRVSREIRELVEACSAEGLLLIVEILTYRLDDESEEEYRTVFPQLIVDAARISVGAGAKVLKLPYPGSAEASAAVTAAAAGVPWAVLSAGVDHETFVEQVRVAVANGASGAMAGRSLWKDSLAVSAQTRKELLSNRALPRLRELQAVLDAAPATP